MPIFQLPAQHLQVNPDKPQIPSTKQKRLQVYYYYDYGDTNTRTASCTKKKKKRKTSRHPYKMSFFVILPAFVWISLNSFIISVNLICENVMPEGVSIYRL